MIVVGAGEVGSFVAESLSREQHDVAVIDTNRRNIKELQSHIDAQCILGSGSNPDVLAAAGLEKADLVVAVTNHDETNLIVSALANDAGISRTIIRIEQASLRGKSARRLRKKLGVAHIIDPDYETAKEILELIEFPGASEITQMAGGEVIVVGAVLPEDAPLTGVTLSELAAQYEPEWDFLVGAITRDGETIIPRGNQMLLADDHIWVLSRRRARKELLQLMGLSRGIPHDIVLLGGGYIAETVARGLADRGATRVTIVDRDADRALELAENLDKALVLQNEITDPELLQSETIEHADIVVAAAGEDDANVLACIAAKSAGVPEAIAVIHRLELLPLLHEVGIDVALSPRTATANAVMRYVRGEGISSIETFLEGTAEVIELEVENGSAADGAIVADLSIPKHALLGAIVREGHATIARGHSTLRAHDHVVTFALPHAIPAIRSIFR